MCERPSDEIDDFYDSIPEDEPQRLNYLLGHAETGLIQAQVAVGEYCYTILSDEPSPISVDDALSWMEKAAASGKGYAMAELGACMATIRMKTDGRRDSFRTDKELYWLLRAADHLQVKALSHLSLQIGKENIGYGDTARNFQQNYLWRRLIELAFFFDFGQEFEWVRNVEGGADKLQDLYNSFSMPDRESWITDKHVEEAEAMVAQWLRDHPEAFAKFDTKGGCRLEKEDWGHYDEVNKALARYQLHIVPPGILREGISPDLE